MATFLASSLRLFSVTVSSIPRRINSFSFCASLSGGQKWRVSNGMASDGLAYGPLTDLPDWSFADGQGAPETKRRKRRRHKRLCESEDKFFSKAGGVLHLQLKPIGVDFTEGGKPENPERIMGFFQEVDDGIKEDDPYKGVAKR